VKIVVPTCGRRLGKEGVSNGFMDEGVVISLLKQIYPVVARMVKIH
jgi:hypothetical protein